MFKRQTSFCHWRHITWRGSCGSIITSIRSVTRLSWQVIARRSAACRFNTVTFIHSVVTRVSCRSVIVTVDTCVLIMKTGNGSVFIDTWWIFRHVWRTFGKIVVVIGWCDASCRHWVVVTVGWHRRQKVFVSKSFVHFSICNCIWCCARVVKQIQWSWGYGLYVQPPDKPNLRLRWE